MTDNGKVNIFNAINVLKYTICDYFIDPYDIFAINHDLRDLMMCCKLINEQLFHICANKFYFKLVEVQKFNESKKSMIKNVIWMNAFDPIQIFDIAPNIRSLRYYNECPLRIEFFNPKLKFLILDTCVDIDYFNLKLLPSSLLGLHMPINFNLKIKEGSLPPELTILDIGTQFNQKITSGMLPCSITDLTFGAFFNQLIEVNTLPQYLKYLTFEGGDKITLMPNVLPNSLISLELYDFNEPLFLRGTFNYMLPRNLTQLEMGEKFDQPLDPGILPDNLIVLNLGGFYNQKLMQYSLPKKLKNLRLNSHYKYPLIDVLAHLTDLEIIQFAHSKNKHRHIKIIPEIIPKNIKKLLFEDRKFNKLSIEQNAFQIFSDRSIELSFNQKFIVMFKSTFCRFIDAIMDK